MNINDLTLIITTFERKDSLLKLLKSIRKYYPKLHIIIGDNSKIPYGDSILKTYPDLDINYLNLPFDCGVSYARNELVRQVITPLFLLNDDDLVYDDKVDIVGAIELMNRHNIDLLGGHFKNFKKSRSRWVDFKIMIKKIMLLKYKSIFEGESKNHIGEYYFKENQFRMYKYVYFFPELVKTSFTHNIFIAKTEKIKNQILWDEKMKVNEHLDFFISANTKGLNIYYTNKLGIKHYPRRNSTYASFRNRGYRDIFKRKYNVDDYIVTDIYNYKKSYKD